MYVVFLDIMLLHTLTDYSINIAYIFGKPKNSCDLLYCGGLEPNLQYLQGVPVVKVIIAKSAFTIWHILF